jgi:hypothetical protein
LNVATTLNKALRWTAVRDASFTDLRGNGYNRLLKAMTNGSNPALLPSFTYTVPLLAGEDQIARLEKS